VQAEVRPSGELPGLPDGDVPVRPLLKPYTVLWYALGNIRDAADAVAEIPRREIARRLTRRGELRALRELGPIRNALSAVKTAMSEEVEITLADQALYSTVEIGGPDL